MFITGASSGIGLQVAKDVAAAGVKVVLGARRTEKLEDAVAEIQAAGGEASCVTCDVTDGPSIAKAIDHCVEKFGKIDAVLANAGIEGPVRKGITLENAPDDELSSVADVNIGGVLRTIKYALPQLKKNGGTILVASSMSSCLNGRRILGGNQQLKSDQFSMFIPYATTKAACDHIVRLCAGVYEPDKIDVIGLNYCSFASEMMDRDKHRLAIHIRGNPYFKQNLGDASSIAKVILPILDKTSAWKSGDCVLVDHDVTIHAKHFYNFLWDKQPGELGGWPNPKQLEPIMKDVSGHKTPDIAKLTRAYAPKK